MAWRISRRLMNRNTDAGRSATSYIDQWHLSTVKPASFYEEQAAPGLRRKSYFYSVDLQGRVFLEETIPKNLATSIKNHQFLDFFFRRMRRLKPREHELLRAIQADGDYPFVSPCGPELNFVRPADSVVVFHTIVKTQDNAEDVSSWRLVFGGSLSQPFNPTKIVVSKKSGRLYHELVSKEDHKDKLLTSLHSSFTSEYGLLRSSVAVALSDNIVVTDRAATETHADIDLEVSDEAYPIPWLPEHAEPGPWSMPIVDETVT